VTSGVAVPPLSPFARHVVAAKAGTYFAMGTGILRCDKTKFYPLNPDFHSH
jgi:hypothetical protein